MSDTLDLLRHTALLFDDDPGDDLDGLRSEMQAYALLIAETVRQCEGAVRLGPQEIAFCLQVESSSRGVSARKPLCAVFQ